MLDGSGWTAACARLIDRAALHICPASPSYGGQGFRRSAVNACRAESRGNGFRAGGSEARHIKKSSLGRSRHEHPVYCHRLHRIALAPGRRRHWSHAAAGRPVACHRSRRPRQGRRWWRLGGRRQRRRRRHQHGRGRWRSHRRRRHQHGRGRRTHRRRQYRHGPHRWRRQYRHGPHRWRRHQHGPHRRRRRIRRALDRRSAPRQPRGRRALDRRWRRQPFRGAPVARPRRRLGGAARRPRLRRCQSAGECGRAGQPRRRRRGGDIHHRGGARTAGQCQSRRRPRGARQSRHRQCGVPLRPRSSRPRSARPRLRRPRLQRPRLPRPLPPPLALAMVARRHRRRLDRPGVLALRFLRLLRLRVLALCL